MKKQAFTLVELIVVITILAILGTIGFISLQGFSIDARDSKRISELSEIRGGLQIYQARNSLLPTPSEQSVIIGSGSTNLIIQGYAGESVLNEIRMNGNPKDPLDEDSYYTYSVNASKTKFQLLALLENDDNLTSFNTLNIIPTTHASYTNRYIYTLGQNVGMLLNETTNAPLNELQSGILDLSTDTNNYKVVFGNNNEASTLSGELLYTEIITQTNDSGTTQTIYSNCEATTYDGYTIGGLSHGQIEIFTKTIDNGEKTVEASCYNGNITYGENETTSCSTNYVVDGGTCILGTCSGSIPPNAEMNGTQGSSTWSYSETSGICKYICQNGYHTEDTGNTCISSTRSCTIENGTGQETWNTQTGTWNACQVLSCNSGYFNNNGSCEPQWSGDITNGYTFGNNLYPKSCNDLLVSTVPNFKVSHTSSPWNGSKFVDGVYFIKSDSGDAFKIYCDMTNDGGGWSLVGVSKPGDYNNLFNENKVGLNIDINSVNTSKLSTYVINNIMKAGNSQLRLHKNGQEKFIFTYNNLDNNPLSFTIFKSYNLRVTDSFGRTSQFYDSHPHFIIGAAITTDNFISELCNGCRQTFTVFNTSTQKLGVVGDSAWYPSLKRTGYNSTQLDTKSSTYNDGLIYVK